MTPCICTYVVSYDTYICNLSTYMIICSLNINITLHLWHRTYYRYFSLNDNSNVLLFECNQMFDQSVNRLFINLSVVAQNYDTDVNKEYVILGNSIILKCQVPSFVADFIEVISWHTDEKEDFFPGNNYG